MNATELAQAMLQWQELMEQADNIEREIVQAVLELQKTQTVGNVRATYNKPRKTYDYQAACEKEQLTETQLAPYAKTSIDYKKACTEFLIKDVPFTESSAKVTLKLLV